MHAARYSTHPRCRLAVLGGCLLLGSACETIQSGNLAIPLDARGKALTTESTVTGIVVSGQELPNLSSPLFGALEITFENRSSHWAHLHSIQLRFGPEALDRAVFLPTGYDLSAWSQAALRRDAIRRNNTELALAFISAAALMAGHERSRTIGAASGLVAITSLSALALTATDDLGGCSPGGASVPADHLLSGPISVPPGLFSKRWVVLHTPDQKATGCMRYVQIGYRLDDGRPEYVLLEFRGKYVQSEWQADACNKGAGWKGH